MSGGGQHVDQVGDLAVDAVHARIEDDGNVRLRMGPAQRLDRRQGRIGGVAGAADQLDRAGVILAEETLQIALKPDLLPVQRLQQGEGRGLAPLRRTPIRQAAGEHPGGHGVDGSEEAEDQCAVAQKVEQDHPLRSVIRPSSCAARVWQDADFASPSPRWDARA